MNHPNKRATKKSKHLRVVQVESMLIDGWRPSEITQALTKQWGITTRQIEKYIAQVKNQWARTVTEDSTEAKAKYIERLEKLYRLSVEDKQYGTAIKIQDVLNKMYGLYEAKRETGDGPGVITISANTSQVKSLNPALSVVPEADTSDPTEGTGG